MITIETGLPCYMEGERGRTLAVRGQLNARRILGVVCANVLPPYSPSPIPYISILVHVVVVSITSIKMNKTSKKIKMRRHMFSAVTSPVPTSSFHICCRYLSFPKKSKDFFPENTRWWNVARPRAPRSGRSNQTQAWHGGGEIFGTAVAH